MACAIIIVLLAIIAAVEFIPKSPGEGFWRAVLGLDGPGSSVSKPDDGSGTPGTASGPDSGADSEETYYLTIALKVSTANVRSSARDAYRTAVEAAAEALRTGAPTTPAVMLHIEAMTFDAAGSVPNPFGYVEVVGFDPVDVPLSCTEATRFTILIPGPYDLTLTGTYFDELGFAWVADIDSNLVMANFNANISFTLVPVSYGWMDDGDFAELRAQAPVELREKMEALRELEGVTAEERRAAAEERARRSSQTQTSGSDDPLDYSDGSEEPTAPGTDGAGTVTSR